MAESFDKAQQTVQSAAPASRRLHAILGKPCALAVDVRAVVASERAARTERRESARLAYSKAYTRANATRLNEYARARYERLREDPEFRQKCRDSVRRRDLEKPLARKALRAVYRAIKRGLLQPVTDCSCVDCGKPATDYDHRDYTKPLEVEPTCRSCNLLRGPGYPYNRTP